MARAPGNGGKNIVVDKSHKAEKVELKEHKDAKFEKAEKAEIKEHKDAKVEKSEKNEAKEHKDAKFEKIEHKDFSKFEHGDKHVPDIPGIPGDPGDPIERELGAAGRGSAQHFIDPENRPDLSKGALSGEEDQR